MKKKNFDWELVEILLMQMPTLTEENSQFLQSGSQEVQCNAVPTEVCVYTDWALSGTKNLTRIDLQNENWL